MSMKFSRLNSNRDEYSSKLPFLQDGSGRLVCNDGAWSDRIPVCRERNLLLLLAL